MTTADLEHRLRNGYSPPPPDVWACVRAALAERAAAEGLLDIAYASTDTPLGTLTLAATPRGVVRLAFEDEDRDAMLQDLATRLSPRVLEAPSRLAQAARQLDEYFTGRRRRFDLPLDRALSHGFRRLVLDATADIPYGSTGTYRDVAMSAGSPGAVRAAGTALATNPIPIIVPCHRVLRSDGALGGYRGGPERKAALLRHEALAG
jgi:methylated-DNA-[protein]-cysteine S-methyltransferase